jgi:hypothetical protein
MAEWSPACRRIVVMGRQRSGVGAKFLGINRRGPVVFPTTSTIVRFEPSRAVAWQTRESGACWTYLLEATGSGTRLSAGIRTTLERIKTTVERESAVGSG